MYFPTQDPAIVQGMAEFVMQGKHFAASEGLGHFADVEVIDLPGMYAAAYNPQTVHELLTKVRIPQSLLYETMHLKKLCTLNVSL